MEAVTQRAGYWKPESPFFKDRADAGKKLGQRLLQEYGEELRNAVVLGCVRGGLVVAEQVVKELSSLSVALDIIVCRKVGLPSNKEIGIGAMEEDGHVEFVASIIKSCKIDTGSSEITDIIRKEREELQRRLILYRGENSLTTLKDKTVIIVDDGLASGATAEAALKTVRRVSENSARIIIAQPISSAKSVRNFCERTELNARNIVVLFYALPQPGQPWDIEDTFESFPEITDNTVCAILEAYRGSLISAKVSTWC